MIPEQFADVHPNTPIIAGVGQDIDRNRKNSDQTPIALIASAAQRALEDAAAQATIHPEATVAVRLVFDTPAQFKDAKTAQSRLTQYANPPAALAQHLGLKSRHFFYNEGGGASPQTSINLIAERLAQGEFKSALIAGGEALATQHMRHVAGKSGWPDNNPDAGEPEYIGDFHPMLTPQEAAYGLNLPVASYPLFANGLRQKYQQTVSEHLQACAELFHPLSATAAANPLSWFPVEHSVEKLQKIDNDNRWVGFPYPKYLNSVMRVNMSAAVFMCTWQEADRLGIELEKRIFLHGCSHAHDSLSILQRPDYSSSPAIRHLSAQSFDMAGITPQDIDCMDIYSCFPSAVQIACDEIGIMHKNRNSQPHLPPLSLAGGLPYFGGPGNNYCLHALHEAVHKLRKNREAYALVTANGGYLTKHAAGIYSARPTLGAWQAPDYQQTQRKVDATPAPQTADALEGEVTVETYTVHHGRDGERKGIVIGRNKQGIRTLAQVEPQQSALLQSMVTEEWLGRKGQVHRNDDKNLFSANL
ncbi:MAG: thiolase C-terminal domain-containing protein [Gammaproteobacteria bacterium]